MRRAALAAMVAACSGGPSIPADRPILLWTGDAAASANRALLPKGFTAPDEHACAADPTRVYLGELFLDGIDHPQVLWHWAPIVPGPQTGLPTISQPEFSLAGALAEVDDSSDDVLADHPFGTDVDADVAPDPAYAFLPFQHLRSALLHTEVETRAFPRAALGYTPAAGDRALMRGVWVLDCGHPPYGAEMHPPTFMTYARSPDARTTIAAALVVPYRSSLLFSQDARSAVALLNTGRFTAEGAQAFPQAMVTAVEQAVLLNQSNLQTHALMIPNRFDALDFLVCAPLPRPAGASLSTSWRFTARSGVSVSAAPIDSAGCVRFTATMSADYAPMPLLLATAPWPWQALSDSASGQLGVSIDVRQGIIDALTKRGLNTAAQAPALQPDHPPLVDAYGPLQTRPLADRDSPTSIEPRADDQPFPLYGRARVAWK